MAHRRRKKKEVARTGSSPLDPGPLAQKPFDVLKGLKIEAEIPEPPPSPEPVRPLEKDDAQLFQAAMSDVAPFKQGKNRISKAPDPRPISPSPLEEENLEVMAQLEDLVSGRIQFDVVDTEEYIEGYVRGIHPTILERLRQGLFPVQAHLDMHGMTISEAEAAVRSFIDEAMGRNSRCVLLIHGRGINSADHIPVLKKWLQVILLKSSVRKKILAFTSARPHDGGGGASYVLLRSLR